MDRASLRLLASFVIALLPVAGADSAPAEAPPIVFVSRALGPAPDAGARSRAIELAASGRLMVRETDGSTRALVDAAQGIPPGAPVDAIDPDVSFDGTRIVFAGYSADDHGWRIFEVGADGAGFRQLTQSDREVDLERFGEAASRLADYDDLDPCYLPDGRICFVSTRHPGIAPDGRLRSTNLHVMNADGGALHRITTERFGADTPAVDPVTGNIVYSRWWRTAQIQADPTAPPPEPIPPGSPGYDDIVLDEANLVLRGIRESSFPGVNSWFLASIRPDGTEVVMFSGLRLDRELTQAYRPSFLPDGRALALFIPKTPFIGYPRGNGLRAFSKGPSEPTLLGGPQAFPRNDVADPLPPAAPPSHVYASASALADGRILVTAADTRAQSLDYAIYLQSGGDPPLLLFNESATAEIDAVPLTSRPVPPIVADAVTNALSEDVPRSLEEAIATGGAFTFLAENIHVNAPVDVPIPHAPPIGKRLKIEFYMNPQRTSPTAADPPILIQAVDIPPSGRVEVSLPAGVSLFELLRRPDGSIALGRDGQIFHVGGMNFGRAGKTNRCVGCHAGHSQLAVPEDPAWTNVAPSAVVTASSELVTLNTTLKFDAANLVDRRADQFHQWAGKAEPAVEVDFAWTTAIRGREIVIYGVPRSEPNTSQVIQALDATLSFEGQVVQSLEVTGPILSLGTRVELNPEVDFDELRLRIDAGDVAGLYLGTRGPALAEVEVIAKPTGEPRASFLRGDTDCNGAFNITDAVRTLNFLFLGVGSMCCLAAGDINSDGKVNISDPIFNLNVLFLGIGMIAPPFPACDFVRDSRLGCDTERCI
jgi:hypothetical protein